MNHVPLRSVQPVELVKQPFVTVQSKIHVHVVGEAAATVAATVGAAGVGILVGGTVRATVVNCAYSL